MPPLPQLLPLVGVLLIIVGFALRLPPMLVVVAAALSSGLAAGMAPLPLLSLFGESFLKNRFLFLFVLTLPVIGLLEREGLRERTSALISGPRLRTLTPGRLLFAYQLLRQATAAVGLTSLGGHPQTVRPLLAPMAAAAAKRLAEGHGDSEPLSQRIFALCAATDNIALFFGEDLFVAFGAVLLTQGVFRQHGLVIEPLRIALWGLPTALCALVVHGLRLHRLDRRLRDGDRR
jgi:uncharacterized membrane protein